MSTIYVKENTKKELSKIAGELQAKLGRKIDFDETLRYLIRIYRSRNRRKIFFKKFTEPIPNVNFEETYKELIKERKRNERDL